MRQLFAAYGEVTSTKVVMDRESGRSKGFGFVDMGSGADEAIAALDGKDFQGRPLRVNEARPRENRGGGGRDFDGSRSARGGDGGGRRDRDSY